MPGAAPVAPPPAEAADLFDRARVIGGVKVSGPLVDRVRALQLATQAAELAPDWIAPRRFVDDVLRELLRGPEALERRRLELDEAPQDPQRLYLLGRLEGAQGRRELEHAARLGDGAWMCHGRAWAHLSSGSARGAIRYGKRALQRARGPFERAFFARVLARYYRVADEPSQARSVLNIALADPDLHARDRIELELALVQTELRSEDPSIVEHGFWRGVELLPEQGLGAAGLAELFDELWAARLEITEAREAIASGLLGNGTAFGRRLLGRLALKRGAFALALGALDGLDPPNEREWRKARMACGQLRQPIEDWLDGLPAQVLSADGLPADPKLRALVNVARLGDAAAVGKALLRAGWYEELRGLCDHLARSDPQLALELDSRAAGALALLQGVARLLGRIDQGEKVGTLRVVPEGVREVLSVGRGLDDLLAAMQPQFERWSRTASPPADLSASPRYSFGPFASVVHPGPWFSSADERAGRGLAGDPVPGLAQALSRLGRFGVFGRAVGLEGPDGTILRRVHVEEIVGAHLGVDFTGTVAWCEEIDVPPRPARRGARITGAALHEGYWIDIAGVRAELQRWAALEQRWIEEAPEFVEAALAVRGPRCAEGDGPATLVSPLGTGERLRLAILRDRKEDGRPFGERVLLEDLLEVTARHEEGHLMDRARFLPILSHLLGGLGLLIEAGFSPSGLAKRLEYRAQLVALCVSADPRISLAECASAIEGSGAVTSHAAAYRDLLRDFLLELGRHEVEELDDERYYLYQLHLLDAEVVRSVAVALARREGVSKR